ncbi:transmembrane repetitive protein [Xanthomonas sp. LMG 8992]|uniref:transmembrane repetitive protein n=1 Tax=Xanthomonas sp. LMG 8992 TaxID=1591157 RepID=UPI00136D2CFC|nr:transmembrane repetitive protein [Xanthomonas sp. LMG 8992]
MTRAADILDALLARTPRKLLRDRRTGLPYAWAHWIAAQPAMPRPFAAPELIAAMPPAQPPVTLRLPALPLWQAFRRLWWQHWDPAPYDQRWWRRLAVLLSLLLHLLFAVFLLWVAFVRWLPPRADADQAGRAQVEFVGRGTPAESGGGAPAEAAASTDATSPTPSRAQRAASARPTPPAAAAPAPAPAAEPTPAAPAQAAASAPPPPPVEQPLQVTETPTPTRDFVLPPPPSVRVPVPTPRAVVPLDVQVPVRDVEVVTDVPTVAQLRPRDIAVPRPAAPQQVQVREREVPAPLPQVQIPAPQMRTPASTPVLRSAEAPQVRQIEVPTPSPATASTPTPTPAPATAPVASPDATPASAPTPQPAPAAAAGAAASATAKPTTPVAGTAPPGSQAATPGSGPAPVARDGGWATPQRGDDWGAAARNRPGDAGAGASKGGGLFNADGSVRLADGRGNDQAPARSAPGSETDTWTRERIEKAGEWLKRPPYDYRPTSFDKYWLPNATLLEEWVRRGIKSVKIPIPGTTSSISCVISILQVGGGCGITDPNLNEQPAGARPPPNVPFKRELQEDNGSR